MCNIQQNKVYFVNAGELRGAFSFISIMPVASHPPLSGPPSPSSFHCSRLLPSLLHQSSLIPAAAFLSFFEERLLACFRSEVMFQVDIWKALFCLQSFACHLLGVFFTQSHTGFPARPNKRNDLEQLQYKFEGFSSWRDKAQTDRLINIARLRLFKLTKVRLN